MDGKEDTEGLTARQPQRRPNPRHCLDKDEVLQPPAHPATATVPADTGPQAAKASPHHDRRRFSRHEVDTSASILLVRIGSKLRGRIQDLSLSGCRIRTDERFPVGIYPRVETEFCLDRWPFRLGGVIQAIHDRYTVGIRFLELSDRKRQQVMELIGEIAQVRAAQAPAERVPAEDPI